VEDLIAMGSPLCGDVAFKLLRFEPDKGACPLGKWLTAISETAVMLWGYPQKTSRSLVCAKNGEQKCVFFHARIIEEFPLNCQEVFLPANNGGNVP